MGAGGWGGQGGKRGRGAKWGGGLGVSVILGARGTSEISPLPESVEGKIEVLPDWTADFSTTPPPADGSVVRGAKCEQMAVRDLLVNEVAAEAVEKRAKATVDPDKTLVSNEYFAMALDNALFVGIKLNLADFLPSSNPPRALGPGEERHLLELPEQARLPGSSHLRSVIKDLDSGATRVEVPRKRGADGTLHRRSLHKVQDEGSIGLSCNFWLDARMGLRSTTCEDPWHRVFNDMKAAVVKTVAWLIVLEHAIVMNCPAGPWASHSFWGQLVGAASSTSSRRTPLALFSA